jgi:phosphonate transport system substrate-binding protein
MAVYAGKYDIGSIREGTLHVVSEKIDPEEIRVIAYTPWYPGWVYFATRDIAPSLQDKIGRALFKLDPRYEEYRPILAAADITGIIPSSDRDYEPVRELVQRVGIALD